VIPLAESNRAVCRTDAMAAYSDHLLQAEPKLSALSAAIAARDLSAVTEKVTTLHRYNRATVRLTRILEADLTDTPIDPDKFYPHGDDGPSIKPPEVLMSTPVTTRRFETKLHAAVESGRSH
jgi:hypothetical protein